MSGDHNQYQRDKENISYMYTHFLPKPKTYGCDPNEFTGPCKHFLTGITNKAAAECPYCEIDKWKTNYANAMDVNADLRAKLAERSAEYDAGVTACIARLHEMHRITTGRHNFYGHAALELAKLKEME